MASSSRAGTRDGEREKRSALTAEQLRRIEENRIRARQKLANRKKREEIISSGPAPGSTPRQPWIQPSRTDTATSTNFPFNKPHGQLQNVSTAPLAAEKTATQSVKFSEIVRKTIKANLILVSRQRFEVVMPYDVSAIEVFKKMPSNVYSKSNGLSINLISMVTIFLFTADAKKTTWSFEINAYNKLGN